MPRRSRRTTHLRRRFARALYITRWVLVAMVMFVIVDSFYLAVIWPDWRALSTGSIPKSNFMRQYEERRARDHRLPLLRWQPVLLSKIPPHLRRAVIVGEDSRFYEHGGFDLIAFQEAMSVNLNKRRLVFGASTISQQTVKNLFLSHARNPLRKWHELILTWGMERHVSKKRILELYLNIAEFGPGLYGVQAAAQTYFGIPVDALSLEQAAELAAALPGPAKNNPTVRSKYFTHRTRRILALLMRYPGEAAAVVAREQAYAVPVDGPGQSKATALPEPELEPEPVPEPEMGLGVEPGIESP